MSPLFTVEMFFTIENISLNRKPSAQWRSLRCFLEPRQQDFAVRIW